MPPEPQPPLLLTRPMADARRFAATLPGWPAVMSPILRIVAVDHDAAALRRAQGLVFTSAHAVAAAGPGRGRPAICVGGRTAQAARAADFEVTEGGGTAASLVPLIRTCRVSLIHPHGRHLARGLPVPGIEVYDQMPQPLNGAARKLLEGSDPVILPVFSPRSAQLLAEQAGDATAPLWLVAISPAARDAWTLPCARAVVADRPSAEGMRAAIRQIALAEQT